MKLYCPVTPLSCKTIWLLLISLFLIVCINFLISFYYFDSYSPFSAHHQVKSVAFIKRPRLCKEGSILQRQQKTEESAVPLVDLLTDGVDPYQTDNQRDCRLHHYDYQDVVSCLDRLQLNQKNRPLHFIFIGDSTMRQECESFLQVSPAIISIINDKLNVNNN